MVKPNGKSNAKPSSSPAGRGSGGKLAVANPTFSRGRGRGHNLDPGESSLGGGGGGRAKGPQNPRSTSGIGHHADLGPSTPRGGVSGGLNGGASPPTPGHHRKAERRFL